MTQLTWETPTDWDSAQNESGVVHESVANTDHNDDSVVKKGYSVNSPLYSSNLIFHMPLHEDSGSTAYDFGPNNLDGTYNGLTLGQQGLLGTTAPSADGTDDYIDIPSTGALVPTNITVTMWWYNRDSLSQEYLFDGQDHNWWIKEDDDTESPQFSYGNPAQTSVSMNTGNWYFVAGTYDGTDVACYVWDVTGSLLGSATASSSGPGTSSGPLRIADYTGGGYNAGGRPWDVRVYDTALSQSQLQAIVDVVATDGTLTTAAKTA